jgi:hypothetical protein
MLSTALTHQRPTVALAEDAEPCSLTDVSFADIGTSKRIRTLR